MEAQTVPCKDQKCGKGTIDKTQRISLRTGCSSFSVAHPCSVCGRLHWGSDGLPVSNRSEHAAYFKDGKIVHVQADGVEYVL